MELIKKQIHLNRTGKRIVDQFFVDDDFNVPDTKSDVRRIIVGEGTVKIEDVKPVENYIRVTGKLYFHILYVADGAEAVPASMEGKVPFEEMVYVEDKMQGQCSVRDTRVDFTATMIHSRKLSVKAMIEMELVSEQTAEEEITTDIQSDEPLYKKEEESKSIAITYGKKRYLSCQRGTEHFRNEREYRNDFVDGYFQSQTRHTSWNR